MFKRKFLNYNVHNIKINNYILSIEDQYYDLRSAYKKMIKSYISYNNQLDDDIKEFKKLFSNYMNQYIFSKL